MAKFCGNCGSPLKDIAIFCGSCGAKVPASRAAEAAPPQVFTTPAAPVQHAAPDPAPWVPASATNTPSPQVTDPAPWAPATNTASPQAAPDPVPWAPTPAANAPAPQAAPDPAPWAPAAATYAAPPAASNPTPPTYAPAPAAYTPGNAYPAPATKKSNTLLKVVVVLVVFLFVGGALALAGLWYAAQKINAKAHAAAAHALGGSPATGALGGLLSSAAGSDGSSDSPGGFKGDPCRFLSKAEVSQAVGVQIIRTDGSDNGCSYIAKGDPADATSKHMASMIGGMGADANTQKTIQKIAGGILRSRKQATKTSRRKQLRAR